MGDVSVPPRLAATAGPSSGATGWSGATHGCALTHEEMEFCAEDEAVSIVPSFSTAASLQLLCGSLPAFRAQIPAEVPLWMAVSLQAKAKATILAPAWMDADALEEVLRKERESEADFQPLPFHYIEISTALFKHAAECFGDQLQRVQELLDSIRSVRFNKVEKGLRRLDGAGAAYIRLDNVAAMEINTVRPFLVTALNRFTHHSHMEAAAERGGLGGAAAAAAAARPAAGDAAAGEAGAPRRQLRR